MHATYAKNLLNILNNLDVPNNLSSSTSSKVSLKENNSFSLPAGPKFTCPGATKACISCYATKHRHHFPNVQTKLANNLLLIRKFKKNKANKAVVKSLLKIIPKTAKLYRIHESGDFMSDWYIKVWSEVVRLRPDVKFWAYTRSFHLNFTPLTKYSNFTLWASTDQYNEKEAKAFVKRFKKSGTKHAYGPWDHNKEVPKNSVVCPATNNRMKLEGACEKCMLCVVKNRIKKNIVFLEH